MTRNGLRAEVLYWPLDKNQPKALDYLSDGRIDLVINIPESVDKEDLDNEYLIRRRAVDMNIPLITNLQLAKRFVEAIHRTSLSDLRIKSWDEYHL